MFHFLFYQQPLKNLPIKEMCFTFSVLWQLARTSSISAMTKAIRLSAAATSSRISSRARPSSSARIIVSSMQLCSRAQFFCSSALLRFAWSRPISISVTSHSSFFFWRIASALPLASESRLACIDSISRLWLRLNQ